MRAVRAVLGLLVVVLLTGVGVLPAHADPRIGYSRDGRTFVAGLSDPLFDPDLAWVPGDTRRATVWFKNQSDDPADLVVRFAPDPELTALVADGVVRVSAVVADARREVVRDGDTVARAQLGADQVTEVELELSFVRSAPNPTQRSVGGFSLAVSLTQTADVQGVGDSLGPGAGAPSDGSGSGPGGGVGSGAAEGPGAGDDRDGGWLAGTGGIALGVLLAAIVALAVGAALVGRGRARR